MGGVWGGVLWGEKSRPLPLLLMLLPPPSPPRLSTQDDGSTALINASYFGHTESVIALLEAGADKEAEDKVGGVGGGGMCGEVFVRALMLPPPWINRMAGRPSSQPA